MGCVYSKSFKMPVRYREANQRIEWRSNLSEELSSKKSGEEPSALPSSANPASRKIAPEEPEKNLAMVREEIVTRSSCVTEVEVINAWELWDGLEEEEHHQEFSKELAINSQTKDDEDEKVDYKFVVINKHLEVGKDESQAIATDPLVDESSPRGNNSMEKDDEIKHVLQSHRAPIASMEESESDRAYEHKDATGPDQVATLKEVGEVKAPSMEFTKNMSLREWLRQGSKTKHPRFTIAQSFGSFAFPELGFGDERDDQELVFDPEMLAQFEQAMEQLNTDEEFLIEEVIERLGQDQENEVIQSME